MKEHGEEFMLACLLPVWQYALNLMGKSDDPAVLIGDALKEEDIAKYPKKGMLKTWMAVYQMWLAYYFDHLELCCKLFSEVRDLETKTRAGYIVWRHALIEGLVCFRLAQKTKKRNWKRRGMKIMEKIKKWVEKGNVNCIHILYLFEAEMAALEGKADKAKQKYGDALSLSSKIGFIHDKALIMERTGDFYFKVESDKYWPSHYLGLARRFYNIWGAKAKADALVKKYPSIFQDCGALAVARSVDRRASY
eukprot:CAMPEP_0183305542 /NCGR_PEP_ID=MMETSP0160_2-20130417/10250_1 /TAXON_ID=2839 ORGANISM="Odontella Sinensis, Strain Grunow 1884" /NCGR_SAMPLE_ID=MMETSP0160_2 /ASSEMBLY_ACC=CAM_ASM_000250 /LENGTH=249 /DNA_ID=CAMNT_0025468753 /DNA_START=81 /DNA_END=830 /DNA_ORIENTATION=+